MRTSISKCRRSAPTAEIGRIGCAKRWKRPSLRACEIAERIGGLAREHDATTAQVSLAWLLSRPGVTSVLAGTRTPGHIRDSAGAAGIELSKEELDRIDAWGRELTDEMGNPRTMWGWWPDKDLEEDE